MPLRARVDDFKALVEKRTSEEVAVLLVAYAETAEAALPHVSDDPHLGATWERLGLLSGRFAL